MLQQCLLLTDPQHPAGLSHLPAPAAQPVDGSAPAGNGGSAGKGALQQGTARLKQGHWGSLARNGRGPQQGCRGCDRERRFCRGESGFL